LTIGYGPSINTIVGVSFDRQHHLYVTAGGTPSFGEDVFEFNRYGYQIFDYSDFVFSEQPTSVTTDSDDNVYVTTNASATTGHVLEFPQQLDSPEFVCKTSPGFGIAVDGAGDVFVSINHAVVEFTGGRGTCSAKRSP
jgi:hypothetical protein